MLERLAAAGIDVTEKRPSDTALDAMKGARAVQRSDVRAGPGHASALRRRGWREVGALLKRLPGKSELRVSRSSIPGLSLPWVSRSSAAFLSRFFALFGLSYEFRQRVRPM